MKHVFLLSLLAVFAACKPVDPPKPVGPLPSEKQLAWHEMETYAFVHFNMNTFTDIEWGLGGESPENFNPTELDCRQWARVCKDAGLKGIILTAKHHDGFCLWPSKYTEHSVKNSPWKDGKGDVVRELADACKEYGLKFGVYLSPWDRNHADYGKPEYVTYFHNQLRELLTNYGDVFEVWFDGANGGTGYYGGANENRHVDRKTYYDWDNTYKLVYELQPNAMIFGDGGPDVRWVGTEEGFANKTNWCLLRRDEVWPGWPHYKQLRSGHEDGTHWVPAEVDVSIRPGWYYHKSEDHKVKSLPHLVDIYYHSVGRNGSFLLNFPVDRRGLIHETDVAAVKALHETIKKDFAQELAHGKAVEASSTRGRGYEAKKALDGDKESYWATEDGVTTGSLTIDLGEPTTFNRFMAQEYIPLGQRVQEFKVEALVNGNWQEIAKETTIGYKRILRLLPVTATKVRFTVEKAKGCPTISNIALYNSPQLMVEPKIERNIKGEVKLTSFDNNLEIYYTLDGSAPSIQSTKYSGPFSLKGQGVVKAMVVNPENGEKSPVSSRSYDLCAEKWQVVKVTGQKSVKDGARAFDGNPNTTLFAKGKKLPLEVVVDLGEVTTVAGFNYLPDQARWSNGIIFNYAFYVSKDGKRWGQPVSKGEFSNIKNNPVWQTKTFDAVAGRYVKLVALSEVDNRPAAGIAELEILTK